MACYHAKPAWQARPGGELTFSPPPRRSASLYRFIAVPCNTCIGCIKAHAHAWAFRCHLEGTQHLHNAFVTLTYDDEHLPWTLQIQHLQKFLRALRQKSAQPIRFFASGEYGARTHRPHYHAILFGFDAMGTKHQNMVRDMWHRGNTEAEPLTPARISYCAGYTDKKAEDKFHRVAHCDPTTGEEWQPPFINMSRRPGIAGHAKQWRESWRLYAIHNGNKLPVPRYLHEAWRETATTEDLEQLQAEKDRYITNRDNTAARQQAREIIERERQKASAQQRAQTAQKRGFRKAEIRRFLGLTPTQENTA